MGPAKQYACRWNFFELLRSIDVPDEFLGDRPLNMAPQDQGILGDELPLKNQACR